MRRQLGQHLVEPVGLVGPVEKEGFDAVTLRAVARRAGVSVGRIQHYVASKDEMVRAACVEMISVAAARYAATGADRPAARALETLLLSTIPATEDARLGTSVWYAYLARSVADPEIAAIVRDAQTGLTDEVLRLLRSAGEHGDVPSDPDLLTTASRLVALADGLTQRVFAGALGADAATELLRHELYAASSTPAAAAPAPADETS